MKNGVRYSVTTSPVMANIPPPEQTTGERPIPAARDNIVREAKRIEEDALYSSKGHFVAAQFWTSFHLLIGIPITILAALAATLTFADRYRVAVGVLAVAVAVLSAVATFLNPKETAKSSSSAANNYDALRNRARIFWAIDCWREDATDQLLTEKLKDLSAEKSRLNQSCPQILGWAYRRGKKAVLAGEGAYEVDKQ